MRARQFFQRMHHYESRTGTVLFLVRLGLSTYLAWSGFLLLATDVLFGAAFIGLGVVLLLGIVRRLIVLLVLATFVARFVMLGAINPAIAMAALVAIALLLGPSN